MTIEEKKHKKPKERSDVKKNKDLVAASLVKNPLQSQREVAKDTGLSLGNVNDKLDKLEQTGTKDDRIISLTDKDFEMMQEIQIEKFRRLREEGSELNNSDINQWDKTAQARYSLFRGSITDNEGGLNSITNVLNELGDNEIDLTK